MSTRLVVSNHILAILASAAAIAATTTGCGSSETSTHDIVGSITLTADDFTFSDENAPFYTVCAGKDGYADIAPGRQVAITDESGDIVATAPLENLTTDDTPPLSLVQCQLTFDAEVPDAEFYTFTVGSRGGFTISRDELAEQAWSVDMEIGG